VPGRRPASVTNEVLRALDTARRGHAAFGMPVEAKVDSKAGLRTGKGEWGKRRFAAGTGLEL
jgi:hypothetical protein